MTDLLFLALVVLFFGLSLAFVRLAEWLSS
jgi:hypothetical protein